MGNFICKKMLYYIILYYLKLKEINLEILANGKKHTFFVFCYKFYLIILKIKAKFLISESKYVCGYCKII